eukprot:maker-scaffold68_size422247-snap-gene-3.20 protein:Tk11401 transcript:maker-scaffold68_size422247-snap-gene-3.20-mRNA-1 annotation:"PREDICTED: uncharacterized protein LOC100905950"
MGRVARGTPWVRFSSPPTSLRRSTRSEAAGVVSPHLLYTANTLVDNGIALWNKFPALREASTKRMASNNSPCVGNDGKNGTCYTLDECQSKGGRNGGSCASGFGQCCTQFPDRLTYLEERDMAQSAKGQCLGHGRPSSK